MEIRGKKRENKKFIYFLFYITFPVRYLDPEGKTQHWLEAQECGKNRAGITVALVVNRDPGASLGQMFKHTPISYLESILKTNTYF